MKLYYHKTDGGAEYLMDRGIPCPDGSMEGVFEDAQYVVRIDGDICRDAELTITTNSDLLKAARIGRDWLTNYLNSIEDGKDDDAESDYQYIQAAIAEAEKGDG